MYLILSRRNAKLMSTTIFAETIAPTSVMLITAVRLVLDTEHGVEPVSYGPRHSCTPESGCSHSHDVLLSLHA